MELNEYQQAAVYDESDACIVNAKVGSGKTTVLISKIEYLHREKQIPYEEMIVLTFTNKAADEIQERLRLVRGEENFGQRPGSFGTFHSVALWLLREKLPIRDLGYEPEFEVITPEEEEEFARELMREQKLTIKYRNRLKKRLEQERAEYEKGKKETRYRDDLFLLMQSLGREKLKRNLFTFQDLLRVSNYLLRRDLGKAQGERICFLPKWVIVDEVQDCDEMQLEFLFNLKERGAAFFAVGDPNQVIYSWRGSSSRIFYQLKEKFHATELSLPVNYRSSGTILRAAAGFEQTPDALTGTRGEGEPLRIREHYNAFQEAHYLANEVRKLRSQGVPCREIAVFYRLQSQSELLEKVFTEEGIPFQVSVKKTVQDIPILNWFLKYMKELCRDRELFADAQWQEIEDAIGWCKKEDWGKDWEKEWERNLSGFAQTVFNLMGISNKLKPNAAGYEEDRTQILAMLERMLAYSKEQLLPVGEGFRRFLNDCALYGIRILQKEIDLSEDSVKLMTLHASKGLEFSHVFIIGVNYGLIPLRTQNFEEEDEERRLFFVGMTRAKDYLELSYYTNPDQMRVFPGKSRYLQMIPENLVAENGQPDALKPDASKPDASKPDAVGQGKQRFIRDGKVDLQKMRKEVEKSSTMQTLAALFGAVEEPEEKVNPCDIQRVYHAKYGEGVILFEDDSMIEAEFEHYGKKQFMKGFCELERR